MMQLKLACFSSFYLEVIKKLLSNFNQNLVLELIQLLTYTITLLYLHIISQLIIII